MPASLELVLDLLELGPQPLRDGVALEPETPVLALPADVREAQEVECLRLAEAPCRSSLDGEPPELDQPGLVGMQFQPELRESLTEVVEELLGVTQMLKSDNEIIGFTSRPGRVRHVRPGGGIHRGVQAAGYVRHGRRREFGAAHGLGADGRLACPAGMSSGWTALVRGAGCRCQLRAALSATRLATARDRDRSMLGHLVSSLPANPLSAGTPPRRHPRLLPEGTTEALLAAVRSARDRMIVTWLSDSGMRIGELCGLWFCDLHLRDGHRCGQRRGPHVHVVKRLNPNRAAAKRPMPARIEDGVVTGGVIRRASPAMISTYHEYLTEDYHRVRAVATTELMLVQLAGERAGAPLSSHGARQMLERAGRRAGLGRITPHAFRHKWATALSEATGGNTKAVADEGGWASSQTVEAAYAHLGGDTALEAALRRGWGEARPPPCVRSQPVRARFGSRRWAR